RWQRIANPPSPVRIREGPLFIFLGNIHGNLSFPEFSSPWDFDSFVSVCLRLSLRHAVLGPRFGPREISPRLRPSVPVAARASRSTGTMLGRDSTAAVRS